jgi:hypothetical protein
VTDSVSEIEEMSLTVRNLRRLAHHAVVALVVVFAFLLVFYFSIRPNPVQADLEQYRVLSAYLKPGLTGESHSLGARNGVVVILERTTGSLGTYRYMIGSFRDAKRNSPLSSLQPILNLLFSNLRSKKLQRSIALPAKYALMTDSESALYPYVTFSERFPNNYGYHTFTRVGFNRELTEAIFYTEHICGLCGEGKYVYMLKLNSKWVLVGEATMWVS